jgi:hypothetical protein
MKSQITHITAATLLSANEGASILANLMASDIDIIDLYNVLFSGKAANAEMMRLLPGNTGSCS